MIDYADEEEYDIETEIEVEILSAMLRSVDVVNKAASTLSKDNFRNEITSWFFTEICKYKGAYKDSLMPKKVIYISVRQQEQDKIEERIEFVNQVYEKAKDIEIIDQNFVDYLFDQIIRLKMHCEQCELTEKLFEKAQRADVKGFQEIVSSFSGDYYNTISVPEDSASTIRTRYKNSDKKEVLERSLLLHFRDGKVDVDRVLKGSLTPREGLLCTYIGATGIGKTHLGFHIGVEGASQGFNVLHCFFEGSERYIRAQYDARVSGLLTSKLKEHDLEEKEIEILEQRWNRLRGKIFQKFLEPDKYNFEDLDALTKEIERKENITIDIAVLSPFYHMIPSFSTRGDDRTRVNKYQLYKDAKKYVKRGRNRLLFAEDRARTESWGNKYFTRGDIADAPSVAGELDYLFGLPQTRDEQLKRRLRFQLIKTRASDGDGLEVKLTKDFARSRYINGWE